MITGCPAGAVRGRCPCPFTLYRKGYTLCLRRGLRGCPGPLSLSLHPLPRGVYPLSAAGSAGLSGAAVPVPSPFTAGKAANPLYGILRGVQRLLRRSACSDIPRPLSPLCGLVWPSAWKRRGPSSPRPLRSVQFSPAGVKPKSRALR